MKRLLIACIFFAPTLFADGNKQAIVGSKHDLGVSGRGAVKSAASDSCVFCHAPHNTLGGVTPLWDHELSSQTYTTYTSSTYGSGTETPATGSAKLCLSCHDGTVAVGLTVAQGSITTSGTMATPDILGTDLSSGHPVSMAPADDGQLVSSLFSSPPSTKDAGVKLAAGKVECTTCHDPHVPNNDSVVPMFLSRSNANGTLCLACHDPARAQPNVLNGWTSGSHATATNSVAPVVGVGAYGEVAANACSSCHGAHKNPAHARNLKGAEEADCTPCHSGTNVIPALLNVTAEFSKTYRHPTMTVSGAHDPAESLPVNNARHAECPDCHNPHASSSQSGTAIPPVIQSALAGVSGYDGVSPQKPATREYQVCFKCHADSANKPQNTTYSTYGRTASRYPHGLMPAGLPISPPLPPDQYNVRLQFTSSIGHNILGNRITTTSNETLRPFMLNVDGSNDTSRPLSASSQLYCIDCHNNDQARLSKGTGPNGPHGSLFPHLLQLNLFQEPAGGGAGNSITGHSLCSKCHDLMNLRNIAPHSPHMRFGCDTCHDPHGVIGGTVGSNRAMINFDTAIVSKSRAYLGYFDVGAGPGHRGCYLTCHDHNHGPSTY